MPTNVSAKSPRTFTREFKIDLCRQVQNGGIPMRVTVVTENSWTVKFCKAGEEEIASETA